jgi:hypothetical protein
MLPGAPGGGGVIVIVPDGITELEGCEDAVPDGVPVSEGFEEAVPLADGLVGCRASEPNVNV